MAYLSFCADKIAVFAGVAGKSRVSGQKIEIISLGYDNDSYVIFELKRVNNVYSLRTYYRIDG